MWNPLRGSVFVCFDPHHQPSTMLGLSTRCAWSDDQAARVLHFVAPLRVTYGLRVVLCRRHRDEEHLGDGASRLIVSGLRPESNKEQQFSGQTILGHFPRPTVQDGRKPYSLESTRRRRGASVSDILRSRHPQKTEGKAIQSPDRAAAVAEDGAAVDGLPPLV